jgi:hypothetical protein
VRSDSKREEFEMNSVTLLNQSNESHNNEALHNALKLISKMEIKPVREESWFDDLYDNDFSSVYELQNGESWMDDLDEAA